VVCDHSESLGWSVKDVSRTEPFDLLCTRGKESVHVEAKGTITADSSVILTRNEVAHSKDQFPDVSLVIVSHIEVANESNGDVTATGEFLTVRAKWRLRPKDLEPLSYTYCLKTNSSVPQAPAPFSCALCSNPTSTSRCCPSCHRGERDRFWDDVRSVDVHDQGRRRRVLARR
jgi:hypothetical protein